MTDDGKGQFRVRSFRSILLIFISWKVLVFLIAYLTPSIGYDTSSDLLLHQGESITGINDVPRDIGHRLLTLVRWDAIYFVEISRIGHVFEQEWAFGCGLSTVLKFGAAFLRLGQDVTSYAKMGVIVSHASHGLSTCLLFLIARMLQDPAASQFSSIPFIACLLHVFSPAGVFLSAPYTEGLFSFLNMLGYYLYARSSFAAGRKSFAMSLIYTLLAGIAIGFATIVRGNGVLSGIPFFVDAIQLTFQLFYPTDDSTAKPYLLLRLQFTVLAGCCVAAGMVYPQFLAYREYCVEGSGERVWCKALLPSIFTFVQSNYWNVGFLRYWTLSNIPLFLLAAPCICLLIISGIDTVRRATASNATVLQQLDTKLVLPQLVLALLALTNYHVQIITRLSSGYPIWYIWLASRMGNWKYSDLAVRTLIMYGMIQAGLFGCFLPPA